ncbi:hypothetical protein TNCV_1073421 [Trichonephila clavipes]|nr:hypothetical protein TNCV_1073421 [Trichonephila clavipes]
MSESSDYMELSPSKFDQVSACAKLRDTVTGISALHLSIHGMDGRSPSPRKFFHGHVHFRQTGHDQEKRGDGFCGRLCLPQETTRPVSPLPSEPVTVNNSFSDLESENDKDQVAPEENNETAPPKPKPPPPIHLNIKKKYQRPT